MGFSSKDDEHPSGLPEDGEPINYPASDDVGTPAVGRLWDEPDQSWWLKCRWCGAHTGIHFRKRNSFRVCPNCDSPDMSGGNPFEIVRGSN